MSGGRYSKGVNAVAKLITWLIVVMLVLGFAGVLVYLLTRPEGMYVRYGEEVITGDNAGIMVAFDGEDMTFTICNSDGWGVYSVEDCTVKVVPNVNAEHDFEFTVSGESSARLFSLESDFTAAFLCSEDSERITVSENGEFRIAADSYDMKVLLEKIFGEGQVEMSEAISAADYPYFALSITSPDGNDTLKIPLLSFVPVESVELDQTEVIF